MNKILLSNSKIACDTSDVKISGNIITIKNGGEYLLEYTESGTYEYTFNISNNVKLIVSSFDNELVVNNRYVVNNGNLTVIKFYNNHSVMENIDIDLTKEGDTVNYYFANICKCNEKYMININHKSKKTISKIDNRSIATSDSIIKFIINSNVKDDCVKSILDQNTRIVTLGECDASISPNMFINLDDVSAKHGSVIGTFKDDQIFYLMSKGISYSETLRLLIKGYILSNMDVYYELRKKIIQVIEMYWR